MSEKESSTHEAAFESFEGSHGFKTWNLNTLRRDAALH